MHKRTLALEGNSMMNNFLFNKVELQSDLELGLYQTMFRLYDPAIGRFIQVDPLAEIFPGINEYNFGFNNPVNYSDPLGLAPMWWLRLRANIKQAVYNVTGRENTHAVIHGTNKGQPVEVGAGTKRGNSSASSKPTTTDNNDILTIKMPDVPESPDIVRRVAISDVPEYKKREPLRDPTFGIEVGGSTSISRTIRFKQGSTSFESFSETQNEIRDIAEGLKRNNGLSLTLYINVAIGSQSSTNTGGGEALNQRNFSLNDNPQNVSARKLMEARGNTIKSLLKRMGVSNVIVTQPGQIIIGSSGRDVDFKIEYNE